MDLKDKTIKIEGIEQKSFDGGSITILKSDGDKYKIWEKKKDGSNTKAYTQFKKYGYGIGDKVDVAVNEEQKEYKGTEYTERTVMFFKEIDHKPVAEFAEEKSDLKETVIKLAQGFNQLKKRVEALEKSTETSDDSIPF